MYYWLAFFACTAVIVYSGTRLSDLGDVIAEKTGLGRTWVGVLLMASVTSLPELITGMSSVLVYNLPGIAVGDVVGSCMFNLLILAVLDVKRSRPPISSQAHQGQVLTAAFGILLLGWSSIGVLAAHRLPSFGWIGVDSIVLLLLYLMAMRIVFRYEKRRFAEHLTEAREEDRYADFPKMRAYKFFTLHAVLIAGAATYLPRVAEAIAVSTGLGDTFVGSIMVAISTSLPEIVVSRAALRIGAVDLAVGNILGSNLSNMAILSLDGLLYFNGPLFRHVPATNAITATAAMIMTAITAIALVYRSKKRAWFFSWESLGTCAIYALATFLLLVER
jgi:cation:H+ antiporter